MKALTTAIKTTLLALCVVSLTACGATKVIAGKTDARDSTRVEVRTEYIERIDTAYIEIPKIVEKIITRDTTSLIENEYAVSRASILEGGDLYHTLETKPAKRPISVKTVATVRDSIVYRDKEVYIEKPVVVEKPLSKFVKGQIIGFWILLAAAALWIALKIKKL